MWDRNTPTSPKKVINDMSNSIPGQWIVPDLWTSSSFYCLSLCHTNSVDKNNIYLKNNNRLHSTSHLTSEEKSLQSIM